MEETDFLGCGMAFPPKIDPATHRFVLSQGMRSVKESIYLILMTQRGERWLEPEFGSRILSYPFLDTSRTMLRMIEDELRETLLQQEPRISQVAVDVTPELVQNRLMITIQYQLAHTNQRDNLVFPFYLDAAGEGDAQW